MSLSLSLFGVPGLLGKLHPDTLKYYNDLKTNNGVISSYELKVIDNFIKDCYSQDIKQSVKCAGLFAGQNLNAAVTTLWSVAPTPYLTNNNFVEADYDKNKGFTGDGSSKYFNTNVPLNALSVNLAGYTIFNRTNTGHASGDIGASSSNLEGMNVFTRWDGVLSDRMYFDCFLGGSSSQDVILPTPVNITGAITGSSNANICKVFINNSEIYSNNTQIISALTTNPVYVFAVNRPDSLYYSPRNLGCFFIHTLPFDKVLIFNQLVKNLMNGLGRAV